MYACSGIYHVVSETASTCIRQLLAFQSCMGKQRFLALIHTHTVTTYRWLAAARTLQSMAAVYLQSGTCRTSKACYAEAHACVATF